MTTNIPNDIDLIEYEFDCVRANQPVGDIYVAVIPFRKLQAITFFDVRRVLQEERDFERYLGIQRPLDPKRVQAIGKYVKSPDASFPTSVIVAIEQDYVRYDEEQKKILISNFRVGETEPSNAIRRTARVLDGQHRIAGLSSFDGDEFDLTVTVFVGADISDQAQIFSIVNLEQTKVNKSLVYDLYELAHTRSPQKTCHNVTVALDQDLESPLNKRVKRLGVGSEGRIFQPVTQATIVEGMLPYISVDPKSDRDILLKHKRIPKVGPEELLRTPLRNLFVEGNDIGIAQIFYNYFSSVKIRWPLAWETTQPGFMLNRTNGMRALLRFFRDAYADFNPIGGIPKTAYFLDHVFNKIDITDQQMNMDNFVPGSGGESRLLSILRGHSSNNELISWNLV